MARKKRSKRKSVTAGLRKLKTEKKSGKYLDAAKIAARKLIKTYQERYGIELDYGMDDVRVLDRELEKNFEENTLTHEEVVSMGYYLSEVLRRNVGGYYEYREDPGVLVLKCADIAVFPILKIHKILEEKRPGALEAYVFHFARKVSGKKEKDEE